MSSTLSSEESSVAPAKKRHKSGGGLLDESSTDASAVYESGTRSSSGVRGVSRGIGESSSVESSEDPLVGDVDELLQGMDDLPSEAEAKQRRAFFREWRECSKMVLEQESALGNFFRLGKPRRDSARVTWPFPQDVRLLNRYEDLSGTNMEILVGELRRIYGGIPSGADPGQLATMLDPLIRGVIEVMHNIGYTNGAPASTTKWERLRLLTEYLYRVDMSSVELTNRAEAGALLRTIDMNPDMKHMSQAVSRAMRKEERSTDVTSEVWNRARQLAFLTQLVNAHPRCNDFYNVRNEQLGPVALLVVCRRLKLGGTLESAMEELVRDLAFGVVANSL